MMYSTMLLMFFGMPLPGPLEESPHASKPTPSSSEASVRDVLDQAERVAASLESWTRPALYRTENDLTGDSVLRTGWISWRRTQDNVTVGLLLEWEVVDRARRKKVKDFILKGPFLWEVEHEGKLRIKRRLSTDDSATTLGALGRGPLPLPIGMSADAVLAKFTVTEGAQPDIGVLAKIQDERVRYLRFTPKDGTPAADEMDHAVVAYMADGLPRGVRVERLNGDVREGRFDPLREGQSPPLDLNQRMNPETAPREGWTVQEPVD
ncbi:MAG: hypothetical protein VX126_04250 [Planctomycetota bacterium]|nr:hypothetical protein [Planctomycetota bacterium]MEC8250332.1 hypothetical protein [Planctomycetota bacterium]